VRIGRQTRQLIFKNLQPYNPLWIVSLPGGTQFYNATEPDELSFAIEYPASEIEKQMVNNLYEKPLRRYQMYLFCAIMFIAGGLLANMEGVIEELSNETYKPSACCMISAIQACGRYGIAYHFCSLLICGFVYLTIAAVRLTVQHWVKLYTVSTRLNAMHAGHNLSVYHTPYFCFLAVSFLPFVSYAVTYFRVPCGLIKRPKLVNPTVHHEITPEQIRRQSVVIRGRQVPL